MGALNFGVHAAEWEREAMEAIFSFMRQFF